MDTVEMMQVFCRVVDAGSFSRAAEQMGLSKAVVSKYIRELESRLDCRLLNRTTRSISLTDAGDTYYHRSLDIIDQVRALEADITHQQHQVRGSLRVSMPLTFGEMFVTPHLPLLMEKHPELKLDIQLTDSAVSLIDENMDLAIRITKLEDSTLIAKNLGTVTSRLCASPAYLERNGEPKTPEDLQQHNLILDSNNPTGEWRFNNHLGQKWTIKPDSRIRINSARAVRQLLLNGRGIALGPSFSLDDCIENNTLKLLLPDYQTPQFPISAVFPSARHVPEKVRVFIEFMKSILSEEYS